MADPVPPQVAIDEAVAAASRSPCVKSKRGAAVFVPGATPPSVPGVGCNGQPEPFECTGDEACRKRCGKLCVHAEVRAICDALTRASSPHELSFGIMTRKLRGLELVHAKVVDGALVAGGGPSCWQCSRQILDVGIAAVWLYQLPTVAEANAAGVTDMYDPRFPGLARWRRYGAEDFHRITLEAAEREGWR